MCGVTGTFEVEVMRAVVAMGVVGGVAAQGQPSTPLWCGRE